MNGCFPWLHKKTTKIMMGATQDAAIPWILLCTRNAVAVSSITQFIVKKNTRIYLKLIDFNFKLVTVITAKIF